MSIIYKPKGKAGEYGAWACNLYNGCSNRCTYCYNRHGPAKNVLGGDVPRLKMSVAENGENHVTMSMTPEQRALWRFKNEIEKYREQIMADGNELFFSFVSDPCLPETISLNASCMRLTAQYGINVRVLTMCAGGAQTLGDIFSRTPQCKERISIGFTLTGRDDLEPGASTNRERIESIGRLSEQGFYTWASMEPIIEPNLTFMMFIEALGNGCREFRLGNQLLRKNYSPSDICRLKKRIDLALFSYDHNQIYDTSHLPVVVIWKDDTKRFMEKA